MKKISFSHCEAIGRGNLASRSINRRLLRCPRNDSRRVELQLVFGTREVLVAIGLIVALLNLSSVNSVFADGTGQIYNGQVKGESVEKINNVDHKTERYIGRPDGRTVTEQLNLISVQLNPEDKVDAFPDPALGLGSAILVTRATPITIKDGNQSKVVRTWTSTVSDLLTEQKIELGNDDKIDPSKDTTLVSNMTITITRVAVTQISETEPISFSSTTVNDATMEKGQTKLLVVGKNGVRTKTYQVRRENGVEVSRVLLSNKVTTDPIAQKTAVGTKVVVFGTGTATWYSRPGHTAGAASNTLPAGTKVHVVNVSNGKTVDVTIDDHGIQGSAVIDLDKEAFQQIGTLGQGVASVRLEKYYGN